MPTPLRGRQGAKDYLTRAGAIISLTVAPIPGGAAITYRETTEARSIQAELRSRIAELETLYEYAPIGLALLDRELRFVRCNAALAAINGVGQSEHLGKTIYDVVPGAPNVESPFRHVLDTGIALHDVEISGTTPLDSDERRTWIENIAPVIGDDGRARAILVSVLEITDRKKSEARTKLLLQELNHRVKNTLATVQSIANQTLRENTGLQDFRDKFEGRLSALAKTHDALTAGEWVGVSLSGLLEAELLPYARAGGVELSGPPLILPPTTALPLGLIIHELTTNAAKYGPLTQAQGHVRVSWDVQGSVLAIHWLERGGPPALPPTRRGFGSKLIERSIVGDLRGTINKDFAPEGLSCRIELPLATSHAN